MKGYSEGAGGKSRVMNKPKKRILIVDDDARVRESVCLAIQEQDVLEFEIVESADVASGIKLLKKTKPDIVILDLHLPDKSGFDFMDMMNSDKAYAKTKVIMLTVDNTMKNIFKAENKGIDVYFFLGKPFNISELQAMVLDISLGSKA